MNDGAGLRRTLAQQPPPLAQPVFDHGEWQSGHRLRGAELREAAADLRWQPDLCGACEGSGWVPIEELGALELVAAARRGERDEVAA